ncbi:MAG: aspartate carbamoyltransferase, partial [Miltoncostaeaceae bacterium]
MHPDQLDRDTVLGLCRVAAMIEANGRPRGRPLAGSIAITAFFEASTRTRLSFESAVVRLGGGVLSVPDGKVTGVAKGESLADIGEMFTGYGDVVIVCHPDPTSV